ncbi:hypothetical protein KEJ34_08345 [Candidatus Bathyarchaeota archaeon]|nr:hypothetical protein [Candidatus Bathyarchaeota archaeon]
MVFKEGRIATFFALVIVVGAILYFINRAKIGKISKIRKIPGLIAIEEAVGRATEMGGSVLFIPGIGGLTTVEGPETLAGISVLNYTAKLCARLGTKIVAAIRMPEVIPLAEEAISTAFRMEGKFEEYRPDMVRYLSSDQWGIATGAMGIMQRERVKANIMLGFFAGEALALAEAGAVAGAIQIAGTATNTTQLPWFASICDYCLFGEEVYVAGAVLSEDPIQLGSIAGQDVGKFMAICLITIGILMYLLKVDWLIRLLKI